MMSDEMSDEMSERATDIAESTVMNDESMQALSMMQIRDLSERMTDGWRKWRKGMADKKIHVEKCLTPHIDAFTWVREHIHTQAATRLS
jgi:hypothetical protein